MCRCTFDPYAWRDFFHGALERDAAMELVKTHPVGSFLLRESMSKPGGYSLTVKVSSDGADGDSHAQPIRNYFIHKLDDGDEPRYQFSGVTFIDMPTLLAHYQRHELEKTCLLMPVPRPAIEKVIGCYRFEGERASTDLAFERAEVLEVLEKQPPDGNSVGSGWWFARNALGMTGLIPVNHIKTVSPKQGLTRVELGLAGRWSQVPFQYEDGDEVSLFANPAGSSSDGSSSRHSANSMSSAMIPPPSTADGHAKLKPPIAPAWVRAIADRNPSIFDKEAFVLKRGEILYLSEVMPSGMCRGQNGRKEKGIFPLTYVEYTNLPLNSGPWSVKLGGEQTANDGVID